MGDRCICCGERAAEFHTQTARHCYECNRLVGREPDMSDAWPLLFARSMARLARRAEVRQLQEDICMGVYSIAMQNYHHGARTPRNERMRDESELFRSALSRLAALALEVEP